MPSLYRRYLAHILVSTTIASIMLGSYASVVLAPPGGTPKATWTTNPLVISFTATGVGSSASLPDSVTCSPPAGPVQFQAKSSNPSKMMLSVFPASAACGPVSVSVMVTATCQVLLCAGSYSGQVQVRQLANYRNLPDSLTVTVNVD